MKNKIAFYLLMLFIVATIVFIFVAPIVQINKIEADAKRPKSERVMK
jgi:hypothetical protein